VQQVVGEIALGIDQDCGDTLQRGFFEQDQAHAGFARAGHTGYDGMCGEVAGIVEGQFVGDHRLGGEVIGLTEIKFFWVDFHKASP